MLIILSLLSLENRISLPKLSLRYSPHIEVIFPLKQFKFWIKEYSKKQVWNKKINERSFFVCFSPPISFSLSRWGIWVFSSCCCFSYLQLLEWSCLETSVSVPVPVAGGEAVGAQGSHGCAWSPECDDTHPCEGLGRHATFRNFGMAFLTLFRVSTGDNWNGIMKVRDPGKRSIAYN